MNKLRSNRGFSLVELAIGLAVITILILAVTVSAGVRDNARIQSTANSIQTLRSAAENYLVTGKLNYSGMTIDVLKEDKLLPGNFSGTAANAWGGDFTLAANGSDNTRFDVAVSSVAKTYADKLTAYFNNSASAIAYDESKKTWTGTF